jgi:hypothetical protein
VDAERIRRLKEELLAIAKWENLSGEDVLGGSEDPKGRDARLKRKWEIIVELGNASAKTKQD